MPKNMRSPRAGLVMIGALAILLVSAAPAAAIRYAAPTAQGSGDCSSQANACTVSAAVEGAGPVAAPSPGEEVVVLAGTHVLPNTLSVSSNVILLHGLEGSPRPTLSLSGGADSYAVASFAGPTSEIRHLKVQLSTSDAASAVLIANSGGLYSDLELVGTSNTQIGFSAGGGALLRNSTARVLDNAFGSAVNVADGTGNRLVNVTAVAYGASSRGLYVYDFGNGGVDTKAIAVTNSILRGVSRDVMVQAAGVANDMRADIDHSNYVTSQAAGNGTAVNNMGGNQLAPVLFADFASGDFHQLSGSPTIDAGVTDPQLGAFDIDGQARVLGAAPDMGADEITVAPAVVTGAAGALTTSGATLAGTVNPGGEATTWRFEYGFTTAYGSFSPPLVVPAGNQPVAVQAALGGLADGSLYHYRLVAENTRGARQGADATFRTSDPPVTPAAPCSSTIRGTRAANTLRGGRPGERILGLAGNDRIFGRGGPDCLVGGAGRDLLNGGGGNDRLGGGSGDDALKGGSGADRLGGGSGADTLIGGRGKDSHRAGAGNDTINAADGKRELVDCGRGSDTARVDRGDRVRGCETVTRAPTR